MDGRPRVDRLELNTYEWAEGCTARQIIVWEWSHFDRRYMAKRFFLLGRERDDAVPTRTARGKWRFLIRSPYDASKMVVFETDDFIQTHTDFDVWTEEMTRQGHIAI